ncbi:MAG: hypothetical protein SNJ55_02380 [Chloroherpetonaceae bacterium]
MSRLTDKTDSEALDFKSKIAAFANLSDNWDGLGTSEPSQLAISNALFVLEALFKNETLPDFVNATSDDSIVVQLQRENGFYLFECFNNGDIVFLKKQNGKRDVVDLQKWDIQNAVAQISANKTNALF